LTSCSPLSPLPPHPLFQPLQSTIATTSHCLPSSLRRSWSTYVHRSHSRSHRATVRLPTPPLDIVTPPPRSPFREPMRQAPPVLIFWLWHTPHPPLPTQYHLGSFLDRWPPSCRRDTLADGERRTLSLSPLSGSCWSSRPCRAAAP
jgi:hypothetical protein